MIHMLYVLLIYIDMDQFKITISMVTYLLYFIIIMLIYGIKIIRKMPKVLTLSPSTSRYRGRPARSPGNFTGPGMKEFGEEIMSESERADGLVVNSFAEMEPMFVDAYEAAMSKKVWTIGPLFLAPTVPLAGPLFLAPTVPLAATAENANAVRCVSWLESKKLRTVVFVSFGSLVRSSLPQLVEIGHGLEATKRTFIWVVKPGNLAEFERWLSEDGFESRVGETGLVDQGLGTTEGDPVAPGNGSLCQLSRTAAGTPCSSASRRACRWCRAPTSPSSS
jgi:hypothetical protein